MSLLAGMTSSMSLNARAARSGLLTIGGYGGGQLIRLASNLILTRLLFPEAFGLMALILVALIGLALFSDVGITPAILQSKRGDDEDFLNTAWTVQVIRGFVLWGVACVLAYPYALFFEEPMLAQMLPVAAMALAISGFRPTRLDTANRHLMLGRVTVIDLCIHLSGVTVGVILAWITGSVWALVISNVIGAAIDLALNSTFLPGLRNRFRIERSALNELFSFGKWVFLSTVCGFTYQQIDKMMIGKYLPIDTLGIYNIGATLATMTWFLGTLLARRLLIPIYRERPPAASRENFLALRKMRVVATGFLLSLAAVFAVSGDWLIDFLYDPRYAAAGVVVVMMSVAYMPHLIAISYDQAALAEGDSRSFFMVSFSRALLQGLCLWMGLEQGGLVGALAGLIGAALLIYPVNVWVALRARAWDPLHDVGFFLIAGGIAALAFWVNADAILELLQPGSVPGRTE